MYRIVGVFASCQCGKCKYNAPESHGLAHMSFWVQASRPVVEFIDLVAEKQWVLISWLHQKPADRSTLVSMHICLFTQRNFQKKQLKLIW